MLCKLKATHTTQVTGTIGEQSEMAILQSKTTTTVTTTKTSCHSWIGYEFWSSRGGGRRRRRQYFYCIVCLFVLIGTHTSKTFKHLRLVSEIYNEEDEYYINGPPTRLDNDSRTMSTVSSSTINNITTTTTTTRPKLYLHVGPQKTATTTIQNLSVLYGKVLLREDNIEYIGKVNQEMLHLFPFENDRTRPLTWEMLRVGPHHRSATKVIANLSNKLTDLARQNQHVIMSAEEFSTFYLHDLTTNVVQPLHGIIDGLFDVHVVIAYRQYPDWLLSYYKYDIRSNIMYWPGKWNRLQKMMNMDAEQSSNNATSIFPNGTLPEDLRPSKLREYLYQPKLQPRLKQLIQIYNSHPWTVHIMPFSKEDIGKTFFCDTIKEAKVTCRHHQNISTIHGVQKSNTANKRMDDYLLISTFARYKVVARNHTKGITTNRTRAVELIATSWEEWSSSRSYHELSWDLRSKWKNPHDVGVSPGDLDGLALILPSPINNASLVNNIEVEQWIQGHGGGENVIPMECPTEDEYDFFWDTMLEEERLMNLHNGKDLTSTDEKILKESFMDDVNSHKYCNVDLDVLDTYNPSWRQHIDLQWKKLKRRENSLKNLDRKRKRTKSDNQMKEATTADVDRKNNGANNAGPDIRRNFATNSGQPLITIHGHKEK